MGKDKITKIEYDENGGKVTKQTVSAEVGYSEKTQSLWVRIMNRKGQSLWVRIMNRKGRSTEFHISKETIDDKKI